MKYLIVLLFATNAHAYTSYNSDLECTEVSNSRGIGVSCVSQASIEKDKAQLKLIRLQIKIAEKQLKEMEAKEKTNENNQTGSK